MTKYNFIPYHQKRLPEGEMLSRARDFYDKMNRRRSIRHFSDEPISRELIELAIRTAATAPSGANRQPWHFVAVSDPNIKREIRIAAEKEERESYEGGRMPPDWLEALEPLGTSWEKPYLEIVPWIVVVFAELHGINPDATKRKNYYVQESVGIACGLFITALHHMGLCTLTHTPSPMGFLSRILARPENEKPYILFPVGYPAKDATVPDIAREPMGEYTSFRE
jgi:nitroreductase